MTHTIETLLQLADDFAYNYRWSSDSVSVEWRAALSTALQEVLAERDRYIDSAKLWNDRNSKMGQDINALQAECETLQLRNQGLAEDAARYRWLTMTSDTNQMMVYSTLSDQLLFGRAADAAIDAAMEKQE
jgi:hypothetical protein